MTGGAKRSAFLSTLALYLGSFFLNVSATSPLARTLSRRQSSSDVDFNWTAVEPSNTLTWTPCYGVLECTRFAVPLDYNDTSSGQAAIAIAKVPSPIQPGEDGYKGQVLVNPGGPGDSGVSFVLASGERLRQYIGDGYDILGFDPRGVGFTTPPLVVFQPGPEETFQEYLLSRSANETRDSIGALFASSQTFGKVAAARVPDIGPFVSTPAVARDMLNIVNASGSDKLNYWGFSYGTVLGATFAAMFPDNVGRFIIDGVVDSEAYYAGTYGHDLADTDKEINDIFQACVDAGPSVCPLYESSASKVSARVDKLVESLKTQPLSFYNSTIDEYGVVDYAAAKTAVLRTLYTPYNVAGGSTTLFLALAAAEQGDGRLLYELYIGAAISSPFVCPTVPSAQVTFASGNENLYSVTCGDTSRSPFSLDELRAFYEEMSQDSKFIGEVWHSNLGCAGWTIRAKELINPNFNTTTSFPLLVIGNTADPFTPLRSAQKMSGLFSGSVLLQQNSSGHTSFSANSSCTASVVQGYFENGTLPEKGTVCGIESTYFPQ